MLEHLSTDEARVAVRLDIELAVEGIGLGEDIDVDDRPVDVIDCETVGQVFAHMLRDTQVFNTAIDLLPTGEATPRSMRIVSTQAVFPCRVCGWANACGEPAGEDCHS